MMRKRKAAWWFLLVAGLVLINFIAARLHARFDLTEDKRYSLTPATTTLLRTMEHDLLIDVFLSGSLPSEFRKLANTTQEFLGVMKDANPGLIRYRVLDPQDEAVPGKKWGDSLMQMGASPINLSVQVKAGQENRIVFPYAVVRYGGQTDLVNLFSSSKRNVAAAELNNAEAMMEYQFLKTIDRIQHPGKPLIAYAVGNGEPTGAEVFSLQHTVDPELIDPQKLPGEVAKYFPGERSKYHLGLFDLQKQPSIPDTFKVLLIVKPSAPFGEAEKLKIDQYIMRGGKVMWFIDNLHAEADSLSIKSQLIAYDRNLNLQDLLFHYGVRINPDLLMDLQSDFLPFAVGGSTTDPQYEFLHWNYYPLFEPRSNHLITKNLGLVAGRFVNTIDTVEADDVRKTYLLLSSPNSRTISTPALISPNENRNTPEDALFRQHDLPAAVLLEGRFTSFFKGRIGKERADSLAAYGGFRDRSSESKMIVVADGDVVLNDVTSKGPLPMGMNSFTVGSNYEYQFANRDFLLNCLEYLTSSSSIIQTRNKEIVLRLLDAKKVEREKTTWQLINIILPIALVVIFGFMYQQVRRLRFAGNGKTMPSAPSVEEIKE